MIYLETADCDRHLKDSATQLFPQDKTGTVEAVAWHFEDDTLALCGDVEEVKVYTIDPYQWDEDDSPQAEKALAEMFWAMIRDTSETPDQAVADMLADPVMMNEAFSNWTDMLCKDGTICADAYNDLAPELEDFV